MAFPKPISCPSCLTLARLYACFKAAVKTELVSGQMTHHLLDIFSISLLHESKQALICRKSYRLLSFTLEIVPLTKGATAKNGVDDIVQTGTDPPQPMVD